jgi:hypothetical protein
LPDAVGPMIDSRRDITMCRVDLPRKGNVFILYNVRAWEEM